MPQQRGRAGQPARGPQRAGVGRGGAAGGGGRGLGVGGQLTVSVQGGGVWALGEGSGEAGVCGT